MPDTNDMSPDELTRDIARHRLDLVSRIKALQSNVRGKVNVRARADVLRARATQAARGAAEQARVRGTELWHTSIDQARAHRSAVIAVAAGLALAAAGWLFWRLRRA